MRSVLEVAILENIVVGDSERYELPDSAMPYLAMLYKRVGDLPTAKVEIYRALQLEIALEETLESPAAAARLRSLRTIVPKVLDGVRTRLRRLTKQPSAIDRTRRFLRSQGREVVLRAPSNNRHQEEPNKWQSKSNPNE